MKYEILADAWCGPIQLTLAVGNDVPTSNELNVGAHNDINPMMGNIV